MFIVLDIYDEVSMDYRPRNLMLSSIIYFYPKNYNDIDAGTIIFTGHNNIICREPLDVVAVKVNELFTHAYNIMGSDIISVINRTPTRIVKKKPTKKK